MINWGLGPQSGGFQNALATGLQFGQQIAAKRKEDEYKNALTGYAQNPTQETLAPVMAANPEVGMKLAGDLQKRTADQSKALNDAIGQATLDVMQRPPEQRGAAWDAYVDQFAQRYPSAAQYKGKFNDQVGLSILAESGLIEKYQAAQEPRIMPVQPGGYVASMSRDGSNAQYIIGPQGTTPQGPAQSDWTSAFTPEELGVMQREAQRRMQGQNVPNGNPTNPNMRAPQVGAVEDGYIFLGGDPADPKNWRQQ